MCNAGLMSYLGSVCQWHQTVWWYWLRKQRFQARWSMCSLCNVWNVSSFQAWQAWERQVTSSIRTLDQQRSGVLFFRTKGTNQKYTSDIELLYLEGLDHWKLVCRDDNTRVCPAHRQTLWPFRLTELKEVNITNRFSINELIEGVNLTKFYRYNGSFTTPDCNEAVVWTVFEEPINVTAELVSGPFLLMDRRKRWNHV